MTPLELTNIRLAQQAITPHSLRFSAKNSQERCALLRHRSRPRHV